MKSCVAIAALFAASCRLAPIPTEVVVAPKASPPIHILLVEHGVNGGSLDVVNEAGERQRPLYVVAEGATVRDANPVISADGAWVVFASSRGRHSIDQTSIWAAPRSFGATPIRLTDSGGVDLYPTLSPDGHTLVFVSNRAGDLSLWTAPVEVRGDRLVLRSPPTEIRNADKRSAAMTPSIAADGRIAFAAIQFGENTFDSAKSRIAIRGVDGNVTLLTDGPADVSPAFSPDGKRIAFARPTVRVLPGGSTENDAAKGKDVTTIDSDLWIWRDGVATKLVDLPGTEESGPVWSRDGRWLFATSLLRSTTGKSLFSSVIYVDTQESPQVARVLVDRLGKLSRLTPALGPEPLDAAALHNNPLYRDELSRIVMDAVSKQGDAP